MDQDDDAVARHGRPLPPPPPAPLQLPPPPMSPGVRPKPSRADKLEAKAARLRLQQERLAADAAAGRLADRQPFVIATIVLAVVAAALAALLLVTFLAWQNAKDSKGEATAPDLGAPTTAAALATAKAFALDFGSYDYQHLDTEFEEVAKRMTPSFAQSYLQTSEKLKPTFEQYKTQVTAQIQGFGVTSASPTAAVVVVFLDQTVHTSQSSTSRIDRNRLEIHLVYTGGKWLVSKLLAK
jgi:Mce-associated membrane protein